MVIVVLNLPCIFGCGILVLFSVNLACNLIDGMYRSYMTLLENSGT